MSFLSGFFNKDAKVPGADSSPQVAEVGKTFRPTKGAFCRTQEFPELNAQGEATGRGWLEASTDPKTGDWVLWQKSIRLTDDPLTGGKVNVMTSKCLFEKTDFASAYDQMYTYETAQQSLGLEPMKTKTPGKLGADWFKQFAWREGLMNSRSGRLYPVTDDNKINANNFFDADEIKARTAYLEREQSTQFVSVAIQLPLTDWKKAYEERKELTDQRLNHLINSRYNGDKDNFDLAVQIVANEVPEVLYAFLKNGFNPKIYQSDAPKHFALLKAAIDRSSVDSLNLLSEAGLSFQVAGQGLTPLELAVQQHHYSHLHVMLSRDGEQLVKFPDDTGIMPPIAAMMLQDNQAFRMMYLEGLDYDATDKAGWNLLHHAFAQNFLPGIYAWIDEGLSIDAPVKGTEITGLSIAKHMHNQALVDFALKHGANPNAPEIADTTAPAVKQQASTDAVQAPVSEYNISMLNSAMTNDEIAASAKAFVAAGGSLNQLDAKNLSVFDLCWKNQKPKAELNRRNLMPVLAGLGADPGALLSDGTTALNRAVSAATLDMDYLKTIAPFASNQNAADAKGNTILHALQLNNSEQVGVSSQVDAILKLMPNLDLNAQNKQGLSPVGLAIRLDRSQTLKLFQDSAQAADWTQKTEAGWSYLDLAFTKACAKEKIVGCPKADRVMAASEKLQGLVLDMLDQAPAEQGSGINEMVSRARPDGQTLLDAMTSESAPAASIERLKKFNVLKGAVKKPKLTVSPP